MHLMTHVRDGVIERHAGSILTAGARQARPQMREESLSTKGINRVKRTFSGESPDVCVTYLTKVRLYSVGWLTRPGLLGG